MVGITESGETCTLAEFTETQWSMVNSPWSLKVPNTKTDDDHLLEVTGPHTVSILPLSACILLHEGAQIEENETEKGYYALFKY